MKSVFVILIFLLLEKGLSASWVFLCLAKLPDPSDCQQNNMLVIYISNKHKYMDLFNFSQSVFQQEEFISVGVVCWLRFIQYTEATVGLTCFVFHDKM